MKARKLVERALVTAGIVGKNESVSADDITDGLASLNELIGSWSNESLLVFKRERDVFNLTANKAVYTIGSGADFNTERPTFITSAFVRLSSGVDDTNLSIISGHDFDTTIGNKSSIGTPEFLTYNNAFPLGEIRLWRVPSTSYELHLLSEKPLEKFALDENVELPVGWERALRFNLALELASEYGQDVLPAVARIADESKGNIKRAVNRVRTLDFRPEGVETSNILSGF